VEIESDIENLIKIMKCTIDLRKTYIKNIMSRIRSKLSSFKDLSFDFTGRLGNRLAHELIHHVLVEANRV